MEEQTILDVLLRIAAALERQVTQHDEQVARNLQWRDENVRRHERERDAELAEAHAFNKKLISQINQVITLHAQSDARLRALELALSVGAVDPVEGIVTG